MSEIVKIEFALQPDAEGYPPIGTESLNAHISDEGGFVLENTPFFATGVALGDRIAANPGATPQRFHFSHVLESSTAKSLAVIFMRDGYEEIVFQALRDFGCYTEYGEFGSMKMLAVSVPDESDYPEIYASLLGYETRDILSFAELAV